MAVKEGGGVRRAEGKGEIKIILCRRFVGKTWNLKKVEDNIKVDLKEENI